MPLFPHPPRLLYRFACCPGLRVRLGELLAFVLMACGLGAGLPVLAQDGLGPASPWLGRQGAALVVVDASGRQTLEQILQRFALGEATPASADRIMPAGGGAALWYQLALPAVQVPTPLVLA